MAPVGRDFGIDPQVPTIQIPAAKLWASEWATSSSLGPYSYGPPNIGYTTNVEEYNGYPSFGDSETPTTTLAGQQTWVNNTLCAAVAANLQKLAYWTMYDPYTLFTTNGWPDHGYAPGQQLAWGGYWGVAYEQSSLQYKPAASPLQQYYLNGALTCPGGDGAVWNAQPTLSLTPLSPYYTVNQPVRVMWTASDFSAFTSSGASGTLACDNEAALNPTGSGLQPASCAIIDAQPSSSTGNYTVSVTATGTNGTSTATATASVTIGTAPQLNAVTTLPPGGPTTYITLWGAGFAAAGNTITLTQQGAGSVTFSDGAGIVYESPTQINVNITGGTGQLTAGSWTVRVNNNYPGTIPSTGVSVTIQ